MPREFFRSRLGLPPTLQDGRSDLGDGVVDSDNNNSNISSNNVLQWGNSNSNSNSSNNNNNSNSNSNSNNNRNSNSISDSVAALLQEHGVTAKTEAAAEVSATATSSSKAETSMVQARKKSVAVTAPEVPLEAWKCWNSHAQKPRHTSATATAAAAAATATTTATATTATATATTTARSNNSSHGHHASANLSQKLPVAKLLGSNSNSNSSGYSNSDTCNKHNNRKNTNDNTNNSNNHHSHRRQSQRQRQTQQQQQHQQQNQQQQHSHHPQQQQQQQEPQSQRRAVGQRLSSPLGRFKATTTTTAATAKTATETAATATAAAAAEQQQQQEQEEKKQQQQLKQEQQQQQQQQQPQQQQPYQQQQQQQPQSQQYQTQQQQQHQQQQRMQHSEHDDRSSNSHKSSNNNSNDDGSPRVLLGRVNKVWQRRAAEFGLKKEFEDSCSSGVFDLTNAMTNIAKAPSNPPVEELVKPMSAASEASTALPSARSTPHGSSSKSRPRAPIRQSLLAAAARAHAVQSMSTTAATESTSTAATETQHQTPQQQQSTSSKVTPTEKSPPGSPKRLYESEQEDSAVAEPPLRLPPLLAVFTKLQIRELGSMPDSEPVLGQGQVALMGRGLLWPGCFARYAVGVTPGANPRDACLGIAQFGRLLRDNGVDLDYSGRCRAIELAAGKGAQSLDFGAFRSLIESTARNAADAFPLPGRFRYQPDSEKKTKRALTGREHYKRQRRPKPKEPDQSAMMVALAAFNSYAADNPDGVLDRVDYLKLFRDCGQVPRTVEESQDLHRQLALCREEGLPGPLGFMDFLRLIVQLSGNAGEIFYELS